MNHKYTILTFLLSIALIPAILTASVPPKKASITGIIIDSKTNQPIEYATIALFNNSDSTLAGGTISGADGSFQIEKVEKGSYFITIKFIGYSTISRSNIVVSSGNERIDLGKIAISQSSITLQETEVIGSNDYIDFKIDKKVVNVREQINAQGSAVVDALINVPSVQVDGAGNVSLRGSTSFTLLIDGQPTVLSPSDALNQIQSASVDKIEIITNPGVKYDSEGTSGIINLIMKKQKNKGTSGQVTLSMATGDKYTGNIHVSKRGGFGSAYLGATYSNRRKKTNSIDDRAYFSGDSVNYQNVVSNRDITRRNYKINGGTELKISEKDHLKADVEFGLWEFDRSIESQISLSNSYDTDQSTIENNDRFIITNKYATGNIGYTHKFDKDGHNLDMNIFYSGLYNNTPNDITSSPVSLSNHDTVSTYLSLDSDSDRNHFRAKADYSLPVSNSLNLEFGYQSDVKTSVTEYNYRYNNNYQMGWITDSTLSGSSDYNRYINSFYGSVAYEIGKITLKAGIRTEVTDRTVTEKNSNVKYNYNSVDIFPSLHLSRPVNKTMQIGLSYSRRVDRPNEWMLIPAVVSTGRYMLQFGNPELYPGFTNTFELSFSLKNDKTMLSSGIYTMLTKDAITSTTTEKNGSYYQSYENIDNEISSGLELMTNLNLKTWWRMNLSANAYYYRIAGNLKSGQETDNSSFNWNGSLRTTFILMKKTYFEFLAIYYGPSVLPQGKSQDFYYFDFFIKRSFLKRKLSVVLRSHNTFDTGIYTEDIEGVNYKAHTWFKYEGPTFLVTLTYRFNNFRRHRQINQPDMNFDSGLDH